MTSTTDDWERILQGHLRSSSQRVKGHSGGSVGRRYRPFWTRPWVVVSAVVVVVAFSSVVAGLYLGNGHQVGPSCTNNAVNYPSCDGCKPPEVYNASVNACGCESGYRNPPYCNRPCANNDINYPHCDLCLGVGTDVPCTPLDVRRDVDWVFSQCLANERRSLSTRMLGERSGPSWFPMLLVASVNSFLQMVLRTD